MLLVSLNQFSSLYMVVKMKFSLYAIFTAAAVLFERSATKVKMLLALSLMLAIAAAYVSTQDQIMLGDGRPWDAAFYYDMAKQVAADDKISTIKPFVFRLALPYLVGKIFPNDIMLGFKVINLTFGVLTLGLLFTLLTTVTRNWSVISLMCLLWILNPKAPFRLIPFYPALTDPPALFFMAAILLIQHKIPSHSFGKLFLVGILTFIGVLFREIVLVASLSIAYAEWIRLKRTGDALTISDFFSMLPIAMGLLGIVLTHRMVLVSEVSGYTYTYFGAAMEMIRFNLKHPQVFILAFIMAYGPIITVILVAPWQPVKNLLKQRPELQAFIFLVMVLALIGGHHTDRFWYWGFPVILLLIALSLDKLATIYPGYPLMPLIVSVIIAQGLAFRIFGLIPNAIANPDDSVTPQLWVFAPYGSGINHSHMYAAFMGIHSCWMVLAEYFIFTVWILILGARLKRIVANK